jgi:hypothetical protein
VENIMTTMKHYNNLKTVPRDALKEISFGKLKGKSDINPQYRYEAMTQEFGMCGIGWRYEIVKTWTQEANNNQLMLFVEINLYIKDGENWSYPIPAIGGDFVLESDKNGLHGNDEAYKMAITDALGYAMKYLGVAADVYRGLANDSKYGREKQQPQQLTPKPTNNQINTNIPTAQQKSNTTQPTKSQEQSDKVTEGQAKSLYIKCTKEGLTQDDVHQLMKWRFGAESAKDLTVSQFVIIANNTSKLWAEYVADQSKKDGI